ncbi:hypothetical protein [Streptomyces sp. E-08]|uniref:hypothetical protein n=1 Tax=Streptomyces sp. E-08 TaxID=3404047 RepID=UPI003CF13BF6
MKEPPEVNSRKAVKAAERIRVGAVFVDERKTRALTGRTEKGDAASEISVETRRKQVKAFEDVSKGGPLRKNFDADRP